MKDRLVPVRRFIIRIRLHWGVLRYRVGYWWLRFYWNRVLYPMVIRSERIIFRQIGEQLASPEDFKGFGVHVEDRYDINREER